MSRVHRIVILAFTLALLGVPSQARSQLAISASCYPGSSIPCSFDIGQLAATGRPIELASITLELIGEWTFTSTDGYAQDLFGPYPFAASFGASASTLMVDFLSPFYGPDHCFPYDPFSCPILGFAVGSDFTPPTFVELALEPLGSGTGGTPDFAWQATDIDGTVYRGGAPHTVVPEPSTYALLATGLLILGVIYRRREAASAEE